MASHIVLIGYGESGRVLLRALQFDPRRTRPTVIDVDPVRVEQARADGADAVLGFGWRLATLEAAGVPEAAHVVVAVSDDALALRITSVVRSLNEGITVTTVVRSRNLVDLIQYLGADHVLTEDEFVAWYMELPPESVDPLPDVVVKVDADITFPWDHFEQLMARFARDERLGIASGTCYEQVDGAWVERHVTGDHVWGAARAYRREVLPVVMPLEPRILPTAPANCSFARASKSL